MLVSRIGTLLAVSLALAGCNLRYALLGFPEPRVVTATQGPLELAYREAKGGLVVLRGRVNGKADVDFILDTGAPVTVLLDGARTTALGLDSSRARPLGGSNDPAAPVGDIQDGFALDFGAISFSGLTAVVIPQRTLPCPERFDEIGFGGVIGADLFRRFVVEIDPEAKRVRMHDPGTWRAPEGAATVPLSFRNGHPFVQTRVALSDGRIVDIPMNVDTGMNRELTLVAGSHEALRMPADGPTRKSCFVNGVREEREGAPVTVHLAGVPMPVAKPVYSDSPNPVAGRSASTIGVGLFRERRVIIDYPGKRLLVVQPSSGSSAVRGTPAAATRS
jgi:hypothetical protein